MQIAHKPTQPQHETTICDRRQSEHVCIFLRSFRPRVINIILVILILYYNMFVFGTNRGINDQDDYIYRGTNEIEISNSVLYPYTYCGNNIIIICVYQ